MTNRWSRSGGAAYRDRMHGLAWQLPIALALAWLSIAALGLRPAAVPALYLAAVTPELVRIDLREHRLPNRIVVPGLVVGLASAALLWAVTGEPPVIPIVAALVTGLFLAILATLGGIGMGDVKLAALVGLASPTLPIALTAPLAAFLLGGVVAAVVMVRGLIAGRGRAAGRAHIAFGPSLLAGYWVALVLALVLVAVSPIGAGFP
jgi:leader peptidase (prepilin peptidase) / N-methyltransferase